MATFNFPTPSGATSIGRKLNGTLKGTTIISGGGGDGLYHPAYQKLGGDPALLLPLGFGPGNHPMYPLDSNGYVALTPGPSHRTIYIGDPNLTATTTWTAARINAADNNLNSDVIDTVAAFVATGQLSGNSISGELWGGNPNRALHPELAFGVLKRLLVTAALRRSVWILWQAGATFTDAVISGSQFNSGWRGYYQHPVLMGRYGTGADPKFALTSRMEFSGNVEHALVMEAMDFSAIVDPPYPGTLIADIIFFNQATTGLILNKITAKKQISLKGGCSHATIMQSRLNDASYDRPADNTSWGAYNTQAYKEQNGYSAADGKSHLVWRNNIVQSGWRDGYDTSTLPQYNNGANPQPPSQYSHGWYDDDSGPEDKTAIENIFAYAASHGAKWAAGVFNVHNIYAENAVAYLIFQNGAGNADIAETNYSVCYQNLCPGARWSVTFGGGGGLVYGVGVSGGVDPAYHFTHENMFLNAVNPNDPTEVSTKPGTSAGMTSVTRSVAYTPNIYTPWTVREFVGNWLDRPNENISISAGALNGLTLHRFYDSYVGNPPDTTKTPALMTALKTIDAGTFVPAAIKHFLTTLGGAVALTASATTNTFTPEPHSDGFRWDGPYNWSQKRIPIDGDSVSIAGNTVTTWRNISTPTFDLGTAGTLIRYGGQHTITGAFNGTGTLQAYRTTRVILDGITVGSGDKTIDLLDGAGLVVSGDTTGDLNISAANFAEAIVRAGAHLQITSGHTFTIRGKNCMVGFDGTGGGIGKITIKSGATLAFVANGDGSFSIVQEWDAGAAGVNSLTGQNATKSVNSQVVLESGSTVTVDKTGVPAGTYNLINVDSLTNSGATLPAGVSVVGNVLQIVV